MCVYIRGGVVLQCIGRSADGLHPFEDVPQKLAVHLKRAFIAARTFLQSLVVGTDVITAVMKVCMLLK